MAGFPLWTQWAQQSHYLRGPLRPRSLAEQVAGDVAYQKTPPFFCVRFKICLDKNLNGLLDVHWRVAKIHFVSPTVLCSNDRMRHFFATSGPAS
jgi:hypothetical protein